ncbi:hypothetical protein [Symmachiella macrocystis]|uniref:hypothetical protein n=1 Tax=Symmachiella macrocystis TaxID=2527985 RepID=UPI0011B4020F|nr:hypothetical protein [Symmachiella macrocystis]
MGQFHGEILDVLCQPVFCGIGNEQQERVKQSRHHVSASAGDNLSSDREIALFLHLAEIGVAALRRPKRQNAFCRSLCCLFEKFEVRIVRAAESFAANNLIECDHIFIGRQVNA